MLALFLIVWLGFDMFTIIIAVILAGPIQRHWPEWYRRHIAAPMPYKHNNFNTQQGSHFNDSSKLGAPSGPHTNNTLGEKFMDSQLIIIYGALFITSVIYAFLLSFAARRIPELFDDFTWITVVIGVAYTVIIYSIRTNWTQFVELTFAFAVAGIPIIIRSIIIAVARLRRHNQVFNGKEDNDQ